MWGGAGGRISLFGFEATVKMENLRDVKSSKSELSG